MTSTVSLPEVLDVLECPFCGGDKIAGPFEDARERMFYVACISSPGRSCGAVYGQTKAEVVSRWNTRASLPAISLDGPHRPDEHRRWLARQLLDSKLSDDEAYGLVAFSPALKPLIAAAPAQPTPDPTGFIEPADTPRPARTTGERSDVWDREEPVGGEAGEGG